MPRTLGNLTYYTVHEVAKAAGVHRATLIRWIDARKVPDGRRDRHNWRLFSAEQVELIKDFALSTTGPEDAGDSQIPLFVRRPDSRRQVKTQAPGSAR